MSQKIVTLTNRYLIFKVTFFVAYNVIFTVNVPWCTVCQQPGTTSPCQRYWGTIHISGRIKCDCTILKEVVILTGAWIDWSTAASTSCRAAACQHSAVVGGLNKKLSYHRETVQCKTLKVLRKMTLSDLQWLSEIFNEMNYRAVSVRQLNIYMYRVAQKASTGFAIDFNKILKCFIIKI